MGGAVAVPSAVRNSDSTTTMRVNDVTITRMDGASESTVSSAIELQHALGQAAALAEGDADVLRAQPDKASARIAPDAAQPIRRM